MGYSPWGCKESVMTWQLNNNSSLTTQQQTPLPVSWPLRTRSIKWPIVTPSSQYYIHAFTTHSSLLSNTLVILITL